MRALLRFLWECVVRSWHGSFATTNSALSTVLGAPSLALGALYVIGEAPAFGRAYLAQWFWYLAASAVLGWIVVFILRLLLWAPYHLYQEAVAGKRVLEDRLVQYEGEHLDGAIRLVCAWTAAPTQRRIDRPLQWVEILDPAIADDPTGGRPHGVAYGKFQLSDQPISWGDVTSGQTYKCSLENLGAVLAVGAQVKAEIVWREAIHHGTNSSSGNVLAAEIHVMPKMTIGPPTERQDYFYIVSNSRHYVDVRFLEYVMAATPTVPQPRSFIMIPPDNSRPLMFGPPPRLDSPPADDDT